MPTHRPPVPLPRSEALRWAAFSAVAASAAYLLARYVGLGPVQGPWAYWPIHGILVGILYRRPRREWPVLGAAAVGAQVLTIYLVRGDLAHGATVAGALLGFAQAALSVAILRLGGKHPLAGPGGLAWFVVVGVILVPLAISPLTGLAFSRGLQLPLPAVWGPLFAGNSLSVLIFATPFLCGYERARRRAAAPAEVLLCQGAILALALITFAGPDQWVRFVALPYTMFPLLAWSVLRCGTRWTSLGVVVMATVAAWCTARGLGPFGGAFVSVNHRVLGVQAYLAFVALTGLVLAALTQERLRARAELSLRDAIQQAFFETATGALMLSDRDGRLVLVNSASEAVFGRPQRELIGRNPRALLPPDEAEAIERHDERVLQGGETLTFDEIISGAAGPRRCLVTRFPVRDEDGVIRYVGAVMRDDAMERELNSRLQGVQRVEMLGRLAAGVAHDLNNMLTVVVAYTQLLRATPGRPAEEDEILREMAEAGAGASRLSGRLMALGRGRGGTPPGDVEVDAVVRELEPLLRVLVRSNVDLRVHLAAPGVQVAADPTAVGQIVLNLVSNARDAIAGDGRISVETAPLPRDGRSWVRLTVADTGEGMDAATLARVFEPFFTTKDETHGSGIGLFTVEAIVREAGGEITATSHPGAGTTFVVDLPGRA